MPPAPRYMIALPQLPLHYYLTRLSVEGLQLVCLYGSFVLVQVCKWIFGTVVMGVIVCVNGLGFESSNGVELLDGGSTQAGERPEDSALDLRDLCILHGIDQGVLSLGGMVLQLLCCVLFAERSDLIEIHLEVVCHLFRKLVLWRMVF